MQVKPLMIAEWRNFAEKVMWAWEKGYRYALLDSAKIGGVKTLAIDETILSRLKEIEKVGGAAHDLFIWGFRLDALGIGILIGDLC